MNDEPKSPAPKAFGVGQGMDYGELADVQQVHAAVQREKREPRVGAEPLSIWLIAIYGLAVFFGGAYLGRYSGNFSSGGLDPMGAPPPAKKAAAGPAGGEQAAELSPHDRGKKIFAANCQTCHQANGLGVPSQYPPLAGSEFTTGGSRRPAMIVLKGLQGPVKVKGQQYGAAVMQPWDKTLTDQKNCRRSYVRAKRLGEQRQSRHSRTNYRAPKRTGESSRIIHRTRHTGSSRRRRTSRRPSGRRRTAETRRSRKARRTI